MLVHDFLEYYARNVPDMHCLTQAERAYSYAEVNELANKIACGFAEQRVGKGERIAVVGENDATHCLLYMAASKTGAVTVPLNYRLSPGEMAFIINDSHARILVVLESHLHLVESLKGLIEGDVLILTQGTSDAGDWQAWVDKQGDNPPKIDLDPMDPLLQIYTSGTTGKPKGVVSSHHNLLSLSVMNETAVDYRSNPGTSCIICAPLFHIGGTASVFTGIYCGQNILIHKSFEPLAVLDAIEEHIVQSVFIVPAMIMAILEVPEVEKRDFSKLRQILYGASPISETLLRKALAVFQCDFVQLYGMTETTGAVASLSAEDHRRALGGKPGLLRSCGRPNVGARAKIMDIEGVEAKVGDVGEIWLKSQTNMLGYHNLPEATAASLTDGWIHTGDTGYVDEEGYIYLKDRIKDVVVSGGENIYPVEVENVLSQHEAILDVAVIGIPDDKYGEALLAFVVLRDGKHLEVDQMIDFCRGKIAGYKIPRQLQLTDELPRNPSGKILKKILREPFWKDTGRGIG